jgi:hypothetical protein
MCLTYRPKIIILHNIDFKLLPTELRVDSSVLLNSHFIILLGTCLLVSVCCYLAVEFLQRSGTLQDLRLSQLC